MKKANVIKGYKFGVETHPREMDLYTNRCSNCEYDFLNDKDFNFCPKCGSKLIYPKNKDWN